MFSFSCVPSGLFFFFQAEDGIRDYKVTGVQTCALPISTRASPSIRTATGSRSRSDGALHSANEPAASVGAKIGRASCRERVRSTAGGGACKEERVARDVSRRQNRKHGSEKKWRTRDGRR